MSWCDYQFSVSVLKNEGLDCWSHCSSQQGPCSWCGTEGMCCTTKSGWTDMSNGCDGTFGGPTFHACSLKGKVNRTF